MCHTLTGACVRVCRATAGLAGAPPGNLTFTSDFEGGNIGFARAADIGLEYDLNVRQDTYGPKHRLWFHFQMRGGTQGMVLMYLHWSGKVTDLLQSTMTLSVKHRPIQVHCRKVQWVLLCTLLTDRPGIICKCSAQKHWHK